MSLLFGLWCAASSPLPGDRYTLDAPLLELMPTAWSQTTVLDMLALPVVFSNIDGMGLSKPDEMKISIFGDSNTTTRYTLSGIDIGDPLHAGSPGLRVPFMAIGAMSIVSSENALSFGSGIDVTLPETGPTLRINGRGVLASLGGFGPDSVFLMKTLDHSHPSLRDPQPPADRRGFAENAAATLVGNSGDWFYALDLDQGTRRFLRWRGLDYAGSYPEAFVLSSAVANNRKLGLTIAANYDYREQKNAEFFFGADETFARHLGALFVGLKRSAFHVGLLSKLEHDSAAGIGFTRENLDVDGQGLYPYTPRGTRLGANLDIGYDASLAGVTRAFVHFGEKAVLWMPSVLHWSNPQTLGGEPVGRIDFQSSPSAYVFGEVQAGVQDSRRLGNFKVDYSAYLMNTHTLSASRTELVTLVDIGVKFHGQWQGTRWFMPYLAFSRTPQPLTQNVAELLDPAILRSQSYSAADVLYDTTGDTLHKTALNMSKTHAVSLGWETRFTEAEAAGQWSFYAMAMAKTFDDTLWVRAADPSTATEVRGDRAYLSDGRKDYLLGNAQTSEPPFYMGAHVQLVGRDARRFYVLLGLSAFFSLGQTAFGFGPLASDVGIVNTSMANPNTTHFPLGNLEGDRAYFIKTGFGVRIIDSLWATLGVRYRDGRPFAHFDWRAEKGQVQPVYEQPRGSLYNLAGPREGARVNIDLKISYTLPLPHAALKLSGILANVYDLGAGIGERQGPGQKIIRSSFEYEPARAAMVSAELIFH